MDAAAILHQLARPNELPYEALIRAGDCREELVPLFLAEVESWVAATSEQRLADPGRTGSIFFIIHLLAEWRETRAYRPVVSLFRLPPEDVEYALGDALTETTSRVLVSLFDGDAEPLHQLALDPQADEFARGSAFDCLAAAAVEGSLDRESVAGFLREAPSVIEPKGENYVWSAWVEAVALLAMEDLVPRVREALDRGWVDISWLDYEDFERDLRHAQAHPEAPWGELRPALPWEDTAGFFSNWSLGDDDEDDLADEDLLAWAAEDDPLSQPMLADIRGRWGEDTEAWPPAEPPAINPYRDVGRNDPCPCGSGRKFKKCCLT